VKEELCAGVKYRGKASQPTAGPDSASSTLSFADTARPPDKDSPGPLPTETSGTPAPAPRDESRGVAVESEDPEAGPGAR